MTIPIAVNSGGSPHESQATLHGILVNAASKSPDVALAQLHPRSRGGLPPRALRRVCEYVEAHLEKNISLQMLASTAGLSMLRPRIQTVARRAPARVPGAMSRAACAGTPGYDRSASLGNRARFRVFGSEPLHAPLPGAGRRHSERLPMVDALGQVLMAIRSPVLDY